MISGSSTRSPADAERLIAHDVPECASLDQPETAALGAELARLGISRGSVYDALVSAAARQHDHPLLTRDTRARPTYAAMGVRLDATLTR